MKPAIKILVMGLPGSGKTTMAGEIVKWLEKRGSKVDWFNSDLVRKTSKDWDFSPAGRRRQAARMRGLADVSIADYVVVDFIAPLPEMRSTFNADFVVWMDTITEGRYEDTNEMFSPPNHTEYNVRITQHDELNLQKVITSEIFEKWLLPS
jgi:adenylylsulfate kinase